MNEPVELGRHLRYFLEDYLPCQRNASPHTVRAYRDALKLLLIFTANERRTSVAEMQLRAIDRETVLCFLSSIEKERGNGVATRNLRLTAIRSFFRCVAYTTPEAVEQCRRILAIPLKRCDTASIDYLTVDEIQAVLAQIPMTTARGRRDDALLRFLYNTGARIQEALDVRASDLRLESPGHARLLGKGRKERVCPLWPDTVARLRALMAERQIDLGDRAHLFTNREQKPLTRFGARYILDKYVRKAVADCPALAAKRVTPHVLRHTTAMHLLQGGVDLNTIRCWLGHASATTTNRYVEIDLEMKRRALEQVSTPPAANSRAAIADESLLTWLEAL